MRFRGISKLSVDAKGRLAVPKSHRERLAEMGISELVVTVERAGCLLLYPAPVWEDVEAQINALPNSKPSVRQLQRHMLGYATEVEIDGSGRILLSAELREFAGIERKAALVGQGRKFEIWDEEAWDRQSDSWKEQDKDETPEELQDFQF